MRRHRRSRAVIGALCATLLLGACRFTGFYDPQARSPPQRGDHLARRPAADRRRLRGRGLPRLRDSRRGARDRRERPDHERVEQARALAAVNAVRRTATRRCTRSTTSPTPGSTRARPRSSSCSTPHRSVCRRRTSIPTATRRAVNLKAIITPGAQPNGSYGAFNATLYAAIALRLLNGSVPANTVAYIRAPSRRTAAGASRASRPGPTSTSTRPGSRSRPSPRQRSRRTTPICAGLAFLALQQKASGAWQAFGSDDPNSTSVAMVAITAAGFDPTRRCWRDKAATGSGRSRVHIAEHVDQEPPATRRAHREPERQLRRQYVRVESVDPGVASGLDAGDSAADSGLPPLGGIEAGTGPGIARSLPPIVGAPSVLRRPATSSARSCFVNFASLCSPNHVYFAGGIDPFAIDFVDLFEVVR